MMMMMNLCASKMSTLSMKFVRFLLLSSFVGFSTMESESVSVGGNLLTIFILESRLRSMV